MCLHRRNAEWNVRIPTFVLWAIFLAGCATRPIVVAVDVLKPAEVDLEGVRKLAIADFRGSGGAVVANQVTSKPLAGRHYEILERARLTRIIEELRLAQSDLVDSATAAKLGKAAGVDGLIFGEVDMYRVTDERALTPLRKSRVVGYQKQCDRKGKCYDAAVTDTYTVNAPATIRRGHVSVSFRVVKVETGQIMAAKTSSRKWEGVNIVDPHPNNETIGRSPQSINLPAGSTILEKLTEEVATEVVAVISPHRMRIEKVWVPVDEAEPALKYLNAGLPKETQEHMEGVLQRSRTLPAAFYYDSGLIYAVNGRLDDAEAMYKRAAALEQNGLFLTAISSVRQAKEDQKKLVEQQQKKP